MRDKWIDGCMKVFDDLYGRILASPGVEAGGPASAATIKRLMRLRRGQRVLDLACGMGRVTIPLARMGLKMTGVDQSGPYLRRARRLARLAGADVKFIRRDMRRIDFHEQFDAVFNWFTSFGYFSDEDNFAVVQRMWQALKPGGRALIEVLNKSWVVPRWSSGGVDRVAGMTISRRAAWNARTSRTRDVWVFKRGRTVRRHAFSLRLYNGTELRLLLRKAGFVGIELHSNPPTKPFTRHSRRLIVVGRRPKK